MKPSLSNHRRSYKTVRRIEIKLSVPRLSSSNHPFMYYNNTVIIMPFDPNFSRLFIFWELGLLSYYRKAAVFSFFLSKLASFHCLFLITQRYISIACIHFM